MFPVSCQMLDFHKILAGVDGLTWLKRSAASSHLEDELPNHPTEEAAFFSAFAKSSSARDGIVYSEEMRWDERSG